MHLKPKDVTSFEIMPGIQEHSYRCVLALDTGAVEPHGWDTLDFALDAEHTFVVLLARLGLRQVSGSQRDWSNDTRWNQDIAAVQDLGATLKMAEKDDVEPFNE